RRSATTGERSRPDQFRTTPSSPRPRTTPISPAARHDSPPTKGIRHEGAYGVTPTSTSSRTGRLDTLERPHHVYGASVPPEARPPSRLAGAHGSGWTITDVRSSDRQV